MHAGMQSDWLKSFFISFLLQMASGNMEMANGSICIARLVAHLSFLLASSARSRSLRACETEACSL